MIAAFLCGCFFGALFCWERWARAERARGFLEMLDNLPPSDDQEWEDWLEPWDKLSDEALTNWERGLNVAHFDSGAVRVSTPCSSESSECPYG